MITCVWLVVAGAFLSKLLQQALVRILMFTFVFSSHFLKLGDAIISVVILDEIGLAQQSPFLPLKVLHSELSNSAVAFIGLSNWALDGMFMYTRVSIACCE